MPVRDAEVLRCLGRIRPLVGSADSGDLLTNDPTQSLLEAAKRKSEIDDASWVTALQPWAEQVARGRYRPLVLVPACPRVGA